MADNFTADKFRWLAQVARNNSMPVTAYRVANLIIEYLNREKGYAYPAVTTLATDLSISVQAVRKGLKSLRDNGLLKYESRCGNGKTNHYFIMFVETETATGVTLTNTDISADAPILRATSVSPKGNERFSKRATDVTPTPMKETIEESVERDISVTAHSFDDGINEAQPLSFDDLVRVFPIKQTEDLRWAKLAAAKMVQNKEASYESLYEAGSKYWDAYKKSGMDEQYIPALQNWLKRGLWKNPSAWPNPQTAKSSYSKKQSALDLVLSNISDSGGPPDE